MIAPILLITMNLWTADAAASPPLIVAAAISMREALTDFAEAHTKATGQKIELAFGSSGQLAAQIRQGAPVDVIIIAANAPMDDLAKDNLIDGDTRVIVATNRLVVIVPAGAKDSPKSLADLAARDNQRLAIGEPQTVPAGAYAQQALRSLDLLDAFTPRLVYGTNVRQVLAYVERGEVAAGIVYATDALSTEGEHVIETLPTSLHEPIVYPAAMVSTSKHRIAAEALLNSLLEPEGQAILRTHGFGFLGDASP